MIARIAGQHRPVRHFGSSARLTEGGAGSLALMASRDSWPRSRSPRLPASPPSASAPRSGPATCDHCQRAGDFTPERHCPLCRTALRLVSDLAGVGPSIPLRVAARGAQCLATIRMEILGIDPEPAATWPPAPSAKRHPRRESSMLRGLGHLYDA